MNSIRRRLTRRLTVVLALILGVGLTAIGGLIWRALEKSFDAALRARAMAVSALTEIEAGQVQFDFSPDFLRGFGAEHPRSYFEVWDARGRVLARSPSLRDLDLPAHVWGPAERPEYWNLSLPNGRPARATAFAFTPAPADGAPANSNDPGVRLVVALDRVDLNETLEALFSAVAACGIMMFLAVYGVLPRVLRDGLSPLDEMADLAGRIDAGNLTHRFQAGGLPAELRPIGERLNDLLARLEAAFERERRFSADLAHELRTPIAELRSLAECALKWPETRDVTTDQDAFAIATQMETLVTRMLTLARGERGQLAARLESIDLAQIFAEAWRPLVDRAASRNMRVTLVLGSVMVQADRVLLKAILGNLLENAVDYAPSGSELRITGRTTGKSYLLQIANPSEGLSSVDLKRLFDRFWRKEVARSGGEHYGLGLSLAQTFATAMGWTLTAELETGNWIVFTLASQGEAGSGAD